MAYQRSARKVFNKTVTEYNLRLSKEKNWRPDCVEHNESLFFWEELVEKGKLEEPFEVFHVDSHADFIIEMFKEYVEEI